MGFDLVLKVEKVLNSNPSTLSPHLKIHLSFIKNGKKDGLNDLDEVTNNFG